MIKLKNPFSKGTEGVEAPEWNYYPEEIRMFVFKKNAITFLLLLVSAIMFFSGGKNPLIFFVLASAAINIVLTFTFIIDCKTDKLNVIEGICTDVSVKKFTIKFLHVSFFQRNNILIKCEDTVFKIPVKHFNAYSEGDTVRVYFYRQEYRPIAESYYSLFNPVIIKIVKTDNI